MMELFDQSALRCSKVITNLYSTSFSLGIKTLSKEHRDSVYAVYGFVRYADEIVDTFYHNNQQELFTRFKEDTYRALNEKISLNPVLHAYQLVANRFSFEKELTDAFLHSMELDLKQSEYSTGGYREYIYGSAEVVGLMCLHIFTKGDSEEYQKLKPFAQRLGAAFQKVNFLRDIRSDYHDRGRIYFPNVNFSHFTEQDKQQIEADIQCDFDEALRGIRMLPVGARLGVYLAYVYYRQLFRKIKKHTANNIQETRFRISDSYKVWLLAQCYVLNKLNRI
ncbi:MAG: phytoene/squalene synthase family protein [Bacteroidetes bacterium]|nr:phytoene/squalene synthase family protein [Bacteroidota bacterium]